MTRQVLAIIKHSAEMSERYKDIPVLLDWSNDFYMFPVRWFARVHSFC